MIDTSHDQCIIMLGQLINSVQHRISKINTNVSRHLPWLTECDSFDRFFSVIEFPC